MNVANMQRKKKMIGTTKLTKLTNPLTEAVVPTDHNLEDVEGVITLLNEQVAALLELYTLQVHTINALSDKVAVLEKDLTKDSK